MGKSLPPLLGFCRLPAAGGQAWVPDPADGWGGVWHDKDDRGELIGFEVAAGDPELLH